MALMDFHNKRAFLITDTFGTKPLWYSLCDGGFHVATYESALLRLIEDHFAEGEDQAR